MTTLDDLYKWAKLSSLYPLLYGTACCLIEFAASIGSRFDFDRFGLIPREAPASSRLNHLGWVRPVLALGKAKSLEIASLEATLENYLNHVG